MLTTSRGQFCTIRNQPKVNPAPKRPGSPGWGWQPGTRHTWEPLNARAVWFCSSSMCRDSSACRAWILGAGRRLQWVAQPCPVCSKKKPSSLSPGNLFCDSLVGVGDPDRSSGLRAPYLTAP